MAALRGTQSSYAELWTRAVVHPMIACFWDYGTPHDRIWLERLRDEGVDVYFAAKWDEDSAISELRARVAIDAALYAKARGHHSQPRRVQRLGGHLPAPQTGRPGYRTHGSQRD